MEVKCWLFSQQLCADVTVMLRCSLMQTGDLVGTFIVIFSSMVIVLSIFLKTESVSRFFKKFGLAVLTVSLAT